MQNPAEFRVPQSAVSLTSTDFRSGDDTPMLFIRSYRSKPPVKNANAMGPAWFHNWQRKLDLSSLRASTIAMPGRVQAFVYDASGNVTGSSEFRTSDSTGEMGFDAISTGQEKTVGAHYDRSNRIDTRLDFANGENIAKWQYLYDATGNLRLASEQKSGWMWGVMRRDAAHGNGALHGWVGDLYPAHRPRCTLHSRRRVRRI
jgi:hypothetical protein